MKRLPFYLYSSYNKPGGKVHPLVARRMNQVLDMWAALMTIEQIAEALGISPSTVTDYIARGHKVGDPRAKRPAGIDRRRLTAHTRRTQMRLLAQAGFPKRQIANRLDCSVRLVEMRLREADT